MENNKENSSSPSIYTPDEEMLKKGYDFDSSGLYCPYKFKNDNNPDKRDIYLKIERIPDKKTDNLIYSWTYFEDGKFKILNFFRRSILPVEEEIDGTGKSSINKKLSHLGRLASLNAEKGTYKNFFEKILIDIVNSSNLAVFKEIDFIFPEDPDGDENEDEDDGLVDAEMDYNSRIHPELSDDDIADAMEVKEWIEEYGLIKYYDSIVNKFHVGNHKTIYRKHLGGFNIIRGKGSYFINTKATKSVGKSLEDEIAFLMMIPERYIFKRNQMTLSSFSRYADHNIRYFERMMIYFGDLGKKGAYEKVENVFDAIKILITDKEFSRDLTEGSSSNLENHLLELKADSIGGIYQTVRFNFLEDEEEQIGSRAIESTPIEANTDEVLDFKFDLQYDESYENQAQDMVKEEIKKYHNYLLWHIKEDIRIIIPYRRFFKRFVKDSNAIYREFDQIIELFNAYCTLTYMECLKTEDGKYIASPKQLETFISELSLENTLPPVESNFLKMLMSEGNKTELKIIKEDEDDELSPIQSYENEVMEHLGYVENLEKYQYESFGDLEYSKRQSAIKKLLEMYRLGGKGINHKENIFFRINDLQRIHSSKRAFKDVDDVGILLNKLYSNLYLNKLEYKDGDSKGRNIYYLTSKCNELNNTIRLEDADIIDANEWMKKEDIKYTISYQIKAESEVKKAE